MPLPRQVELDYVMPGHFVPGYYLLTIDGRQFAYARHDDWEAAVHSVLDPLLDGPMEGLA